MKTELSRLEQGAGQNNAAPDGLLPASQATLEQKNAELIARNEELLRTEQKLLLQSTALETVANAVVITDAKGIILWVNPAFTVLTGYAAEEVIGQNPRLLKSGKHTPEFYKNLWGTLLAGKAWRGNFTNRRKDGRLYHDEHTITPVLSKEGVVTHFIAILNDVTERKRAEEQVAEQAAFLDKARDGIVVRDLEGRILYWNEGAERIHGWKREEVMGRNITEWIAPYPTQNDKIHQAIISTGEWSGETAHLTKDGREIIVEVHATLIRDNEGRPKSTLAINTDITEKKKIETQFMRAQRMESIGTLAGGIAHKLNNILSPIMLSIATLQEESENSEMKEILDTIAMSANQGAEIVRQVLSFTRPVEGERTTIEPEVLLKNAESIVKDTFPKDIRLEFSVARCTWRLLGDPTQLRQVLLNLCLNARDAMPNGGVLTISAANCELDEQYAAANILAKPGRYVKISVADTGAGMPPELLDKIFEPFFTTKELEGNAGLGLSTVAGIVKGHDGSVSVSSEPGNGTTFDIYLPVTEKIAPEPSYEQPEQTTVSRGNGETILVVDDETSLLTITSQTLRNFGYKVLTAADGAEAVSTYADHRDEIALVLTDTIMPIMDGPAMAHALMEINPSVKIIAVSGFNSKNEMTKTRDPGVRCYLTKPFTSPTLLKSISKILHEA